MSDFRVDAASGVVHCGVNRVAGAFQHVTAGALQTTLADDNDAAYIKLDTQDGSLLYGTLLGGSGDDYRPSLVTDGTGGVYFMLQSDSTDLPLPTVGFEQGPNGGADFAVYHFDSNNAVLSATHYGGSGDELTETHSIARDASGNIFLGGGTSSTNLPASTGAAQPAKADLNDGFVAKLSADLSTVIASTYNGGSDGDGGEGVHLAPDGTVFIVGPTKSTNWPTTPNALLPSDPGGARNGILTRFSNDLSTVLYNSYIGGSDDDDARIAYVTDDAEIYVGGIARLNNFPTLNAIESTQTGAYSAFLMKFTLEEPTATDIILIGARDLDADDPDLLAWWRFDETSGLIAKDSASDGHDGALQNLVGDEWEPGRLGGALRIENGAERVMVPHDAALDLSGQYSISAWLKLDQIPFFGRVAIKGGESDGWGLVVPNATGLNWVYAGSGYPSPTNVLSVAEWQHVVITYDGAELRYYVGGVLVHTQTVALTPQPNTDPWLASDWPRPLSISVAGGNISIMIHSSARRSHTLQFSETHYSLDWHDVPGQINLPGVDGPLTLTDSAGEALFRFFRVAVDSP